MAFAQANLCTIGIGGDNALHMYTTTDADTVVETSDYFLAAYASMNAGDFILANLDTDGTLETKIYYVATCSSAGVTIDFPTIA